MWYNPSTWTAVDNFQNMLGSAQDAGNSFQGVGQAVNNGNPVFSNPTGGYTANSDPKVIKGSNTQTPGIAPTQNTPYPTDPSAARAQAAANSQIQSINQLLGLIGSKRDSGIGSINSSAAEQRRLLDEQRRDANTEYDNQSTKNLQSRERGYQQVDNFANDSRNSLNRVFQGANAGNSSVARLLAPSLVGKAAGERRLGVTETANDNADNIGRARSKAENDFNYSGQDIENQRASQEKSFRESLTNQENDLLSKRLAYQQDAGQATDGTQNEINDRMAQLNALFGQFKPSYNVRATPTQKVDLNSFSVDPAQFRLDQSQPAESRYYNPLLKKKEQGLA